MQLYLKINITLAELHTAHKLELLVAFRGVPFWSYCRAAVAETVPSLTCLISSPIFITPRTLVCPLPIALLLFVTSSDPEHGCVLFLDLTQNELICGL